MTAHPSLALRVEDACRNGWPALKDVSFDGWQLRFSWGHTRRANSISLLSPSSQDLEGKVRYCEMLYAYQNLPTLFRLSTMSAEDISAILDKRGYKPPEDEVCILYRDLTAGPAPVAQDDVVMRPEPATAWLGAHTGIKGLNGKAKTINQAILEAIAVPTRFAASLAPNGRTAAIAYGALHDGIVCINSVATDPAFQRLGHARKVIEAVLSWARTEVGATGACVPVVTQNAVGIALYRSLEFNTEISHYAYRRRD